MYTDIRNGGSRVYTIVRKTRGDLSVRPRSPHWHLSFAHHLSEMDADFLGRSDAQALQRDLASYLTDVPSHVQPSAGQIVLRGDWVRETKEWLAAKGF